MVPLMNGSLNRVFKIVNYLPKSVITFNYIAHRISA